MGRDGRTKRVENEAGVVSAVDDSSDRDVDHFSAHSSFRLEIRIRRVCVSNRRVVVCILVCVSEEFQGRRDVT